MPSKNFAAIDIGSNTFRLLIAQLQDRQQTQTAWKIVSYAHRIVRLGEGLHKTGQLCDPAMARALLAFHEFATILKQHHIEPSQLRAVATAAMREATNGKEFCQKIADQTGIQVQIIDGEQEAKLSLAGSCAVLPTELSHNFLLFDIGGGSTEFVRAKDRLSIDTISLKTGVVRLVEAHLHSDPPCKEDYAAMKATCHQHLDTVEKHWHKSHSPIPQHLVGTAGTVTTLAAIDLELTTYDANIVNNHKINKQRFFSLRDLLLGMTHEQRLDIAAIETGRADLMIAGLAMIECIFERWCYESLITVDAGLLEGAWLELAACNGNDSTS